MSKSPVNVDLDAEVEDDSDVEVQNPFLQPSMANSVPMHSTSSLLGRAFACFVYEIDSTRGR